MSSKCFNIKTTNQKLWSQLLQFCIIYHLEHATIKHSNLPLNLSHSDTNKMHFNNQCIDFYDHHQLTELNPRNSRPWKGDSTVCIRTDTNRWKEKRKQQINRLRENRGTQSRVGFNFTFNDWIGSIDVAMVTGFFLFVLHLRSHLPNQIFAGGKYVPVKKKHIHLMFFPFLWIPATIKMFKFIPGFFKESWLMFGWLKRGGKIKLGNKTEMKVISI